MGLPWDRIEVVLDAPIYHYLFVKSKCFRGRKHKKNFGLTVQVLFKLKYYLFIYLILSHLFISLCLFIYLFHFTHFVKRGRIPFLNSVKYCGCKLFSVTLYRNHTQTFSGFYFSETGFHWSNFNYVHVTYSFDELLIFFWLTPLAIYSICVQLYKEKRVWIC